MNTWILVRVRNFHTSNRILGAPHRVVMPASSRRTKNREMARDGLHTSWMISWKGVQPVEVGEEGVAGSSNQITRGECLGQNVSLGGPQRGLRFKKKVTWSSETLFVGCDSPKLRFEIDTTYRGENVFRRRPVGHHGSTAACGDF